MPSKDGKDNSGQQEFRRIFEEYKKLVYSVAYSFMKNSQDANDVMQDVFFKLYECIDELTGDDAYRKWLISVTANTCKNYLRSSWRSKVFSLEEAKEVSCEADLGEESDLFTAVMRLPEKERVLIHLYYYEGCNVKEISDILKINESTVRVRIMRGREKLKKLLKEESV
ncbi:MAG: RNA polymerase sigma factor [Oscillospiraceae bacterium]|nr:RNA polymerase sigma factor [Oscillospiraceae bacterium]